MMTTLRSFVREVEVSGLMPIASPNPGALQKIARARVGRTVRVIAQMLFGCLVVTLAASTVASAQQALPVIIADFNHDGIPDALVVSATTPTATIAFGSVPYGTFSGAAKAVTFPTACTSLPQGSLVTGDFNGDGFADLAFICSTSSGVLLGNGDGTFGAPKILAGIYGGFAVVGDFNHDGKLDIAVLNTAIISAGVSSQTIELLLGNGDGTFADPVVTTLGNTAFGAPIAADINGDGYPDIVLLSVVAGTPPSVNIFGNNQASKFGVITQGVAAPNVLATGPQSAATILAGNFFGTGAIDIAVVSTGANAVISVFQNTSTATTYSFNDPVTNPYPGLTAATGGSFTGSGYTDIAASNGNSIAILANDGKGNLAANYSALTLTSTSSLFAAADANLDGYTDIYTATLPQSGALQLAVNLVTGTATATSQPFSLGIGTKNVSAVWPGNFNFTGSTANGTQVVVGVPSIATVTSSKNPSTVGDPVTFTVNVASTIAGNNLPTGAVVLTDGTTSLTSGTLDGTGRFSYTTSTLTQATHPIKVTYAGDSFFAGAVSTVLSQVVNHAPAVASNLTWTTPAAIVYGTPLSATQLDAAAVDATGVAIPGVFTYTPAAGTVLDAGTRTLSVTFTPTDLLSFLPATQTVSLVISQAQPVLTWATPVSIAYGVPLSATQLNATVTGLGGTALPGVFTYSPASGTVLSPGTQTLSVNFVPTNALDYANAAGSVKLLVTGVTLASITPNTANLGDPDTRVTLTGAGFVANSAVQVNGTAVITTLVNATTLTAVIPAANFLKSGALQITVVDPSIEATSTAVTFTVLAPNISGTISGPTTTPPGTQPTIGFTIGAPYPVDLTVTLTLGFASSTTPQITSDQQIQFSNGLTTLSFTLPAGTVTAPAIQLQAGTVAGTITIPFTLTAGGVDVTPANAQPFTILVPTAVPNLSGTTVTRNGNQLTVVIHGFSNTREMVTAKFHFTAATGQDVGTPDVTIPATTIFSDWFSQGASDQYGSTFTYTQIFNTSDGGAATIGTVEVTLTNTVGDSTPQTAP